MKTSTIKVKLILLTIFTATTLLIIGNLSFLSGEKIRNTDNIKINFINVEKIALEMRREEKNFLLRDVMSDDFFKTGESKYLKQHKENFSLIIRILDSLEANSYVKSFDMINDVANIKEIITSYTTKFNGITQTMRKKGYMETGLILELRTAIHKTEASLVEYPNLLDLKVHLLTLRKIEKDYLLRKNPSYEEAFEKEFLVFSNLINQKWEISASKKEEIGKLLKEYKLCFENIIEIDRTIGYSDKEGLMGEMMEVIHKIDPATKAMIKTVTEKSDHSYNANRLLSLIIVLIGLVLSIIIATFITRSISKSISNAQAAVKEIANGNLNAEIKITSKDEVGELLTDLDAMKNKLRNIIGEIITGAENIASASMELNSTAQVVSQGSSEQASSTEEISSSVEQMSSNIQQNTDNAKQTEKISGESNEGMQKISSAATKSLNAITDISGKISIINDIAFQTNILALNAAVEAARAGEHGRGFAVVAAEVRRLAERSKVAADEIVNLAKMSVELTTEANSLMQSNIPKIEKTSKLVQEITASSIEQSTGAEQINIALQQLNQVTQQNAAAAEEMASTAEELAAQSDQLKTSISFFKTDIEINHAHLIKTTKQTPKAKATLSPKNDKQLNSNKNSAGKKETENIHLQEFERF